MQQIDFFSEQWHSERSAAALLLIFDEGGEGDMARMTDDNSVQRTSVALYNDNHKIIWFLPVDHNVEIKKENSTDDESVCDYIFTVNDIEQIVFGEIKNRKKQWINDGISQLGNTIEIFKSNHDILQWNSRRAFVSNRFFPHHRQCTITREEQFRDKYKVRLYVQNSIVVE